jgi:hypothetical protein
MENQGKRPEQIEFSEQLGFYSTIGLIIMLIIFALITE